MLYYLVFYPYPTLPMIKKGLALISLAALVIWLAGTIFGGNEKRKGNAIDLIVIIYGCINIIAAASSHYFPESLKGLAKVLVYLSSYFLLTAQMSFAPKRKLVFTTVLLITSTLIVTLWTLSIQNRCSSSGHLGRS